jgi:deazaflavin-dependent oxidoreductase (nitroreductase family)
VSRGVRYDEAGSLHRLVRRPVATSAVSRLSAHALDRLDRVLARFGGKGQSIAHLTAGLPVVTLTTIGVKSGQRRTAKVLGIAEGERMVVIASNVGQRNHPAWYYNLRANPTAELTVDGVTLKVRGREEAGAERARLWNSALQVYPGWRDYERRASHREIGVFILEPVVGASSGLFVAMMVRGPGDVRPAEF